MGIQHVTNSLNILVPFQSGFCPNLYTTTALVKLANDVFSSTDLGQLIAEIFIDLPKAFD